MRPEELIRLLGRNNTDPVVEAALSHYAIRNRPEVEIDEDDAEGPIVETQSWVKNSRAGIEFGFHDEAAWIGLDETEFGKRPMVLTEIYLYGSHNRLRPYQQQLPFGLQLSDDRATVRKKLVQFESTRHSYIRDTWDTPEFRITVAYANGQACIDFVLCRLREPPPPRIPYALAPVPTLKTILDVLGRALDDPAVHSAFDSLGLRSRIDEIKDSGEADFRNPFGFSLDFSVPEDTTNPSAKSILLSSVTFFDDREQGARRWPGDLPYAIRFGDSPETVVQRLGRPSDSEEDDDFSSRAIWNEPKLTIDVFYDTMENRTLRVTATAPVILRRIV